MSKKAVERKTLAPATFAYYGTHAARAFPRSISLGFDPLCARTAFVAGVGWATQMPGGALWLQYNDGAMLLVAPDGKFVHFRSHLGSVQRYPRRSRSVKPIEPKSNSAHMCVHPNWLTFFSFFL
jgi:hypothetical protein